jgi:hypothetical protein
MISEDFGTAEERFSYQVRMKMRHVSLCNKWDAAGIPKILGMVASSASSCRHFAFPEPLLRGTSRTSPPFWFSVWSTNNGTKSVKISVTFLRDVDKIFAMNIDRFFVNRERSTDRKQQPSPI